MAAVAAVAAAAADVAAAFSSSVEASKRFRYLVARPWGMRCSRCSMLASCLVAQFAADVAADVALLIMQR